MQTTACCSENDLLEYAEGLLAAERAKSIAAHIDACTACRAVLAGIARAATIAETPPKTVDRPPAELLREHLRSDAPHRERLAVMLMSGIALLSFPIFLSMPEEGRRFAQAGIAAQAVLLLYELTLYTALKRGWFHRGLPFANSLVEVAVFCGMQLLGALLLPPVRAFNSPALVLIGAVIVFQAIRADPRLCLAGGALAVAAFIGISFVVRARLGPDGANPLPRMLVIPAFCALSGVAGAVLARYLVGRAELALRAVREQDLFGKYILHERLGVGGMGEVFRASYCPEGGFTKTVAIKRLRDDVSRDVAFVEAFRREAQLGSSLSHPNLVQMLDCGKFRGAFMAAMEYVDGLSLSALLGQRVAPLDPCAVAYLGAELASALEYIHARKAKDLRPLGLVHCDVNPPNVLLSRLGEVKLADFGVARAMESGRGGFAGKLAYAAPEQLRGEPLDARTDLFGLGLTLHEALTGRRVLTGTEPRDAIPPPSTLRPDVPRALDELVMRLVAADPGRRPARAAHVRAKLMALEGPLAPYPHGEQALARAVDEALGAGPAPDGAATTMVETKKA